MTPISSSSNPVAERTAISSFEIVTLLVRDGTPIARHPGADRNGTGLLVLYDLRVGSANRVDV